MPIILPPTPPALPAAPPAFTGEPETTAAERLYDRLAPLATYDPDNGNIVKGIAVALAEPQAVVDDVCRDTDTHQAWQKALDPAAAPAGWLPWLAQFAGVRLLPADSEQQQRDRIAAAAGFHRGTIASIESEVRLVLTGNRYVRVLKQTADDPWRVTVLTRTSETPDPALVEARALAQKPAGQLMSFVVSDAPIIDEGTAVIDDVTAVIDDATVGDVVI